jgi:hypothetical protein
MAEQWIIYRDVTGFPRKRFERMAAPGPGELLIKDQVFPGDAGFPAMYIRRHRVQLDVVVVNLITYTEAPVDDQQAAALARQAENEVKP